MNFSLNQFFKNKTGSVAPLFAIATIPVLMASGAAIDYSRLSQHSAKMQNALDSALLSIGRTVVYKTTAEITTDIEDFFHANLDATLHSEVKDLTATINKDDKTITLALSGEIPTTFLSVLGQKKLGYNLITSSKASSGKVEVVLVLDNTFSMSVGGKLDSLKTASSEFVSQLLENNKYDRIAKVAIVPFSQYVNVGLDKRNANWMDVEPDTSTTINHCYMKHDVVSTSNCHDETGYNDGVPYTYEQCDYTYGPSYEVCAPQTTSSTWNGCVGSRKEPYNLQDAQNGPRFPGVMDQQCPKPITPLTDNKTKLLTQIDAMVATGETYIPSGLMWGLRVISSGTPYTSGTTYEQANLQATKKIMILMTDGENQRSAQLPDSPKHWGSDLDQANEWTSSSCTTIKNKDIALYTVTFGDAISASSKDLVKNCASKTGNYFHAVAGSDLVSAFEAILGDLNKLRLTQ